MNTPAEREAKRIFWEEHVREWQKSGLSQVRYCQQHNINLKCFLYWRRKFVKAERSTCLVEVTELSCVQPFPGSKPLCLKIGQRYSIEIERGFDPETLDQILRIVENR